MPHCSLLTASMLSGVCEFVCVCQAHHISVFHDRLAAVAVTTHARLHAGKPAWKCTVDVDDDQQRCVLRARRRRRWQTVTSSSHGDGAKSPTAEFSVRIIPIWHSRAGARDAESSRCRELCAVLPVPVIKSSFDFMMFRRTDHDDVEAVGAKIF